MGNLNKTTYVDHQTVITAQNLNDIQDSVIANTSYTTCSTAAGTAAKTAALTNFVLTTGSCVKVKFTNSNTASSPTLNVNSTGAKAIKLYGTTAVGTTPETSWVAGGVVNFVYDGTNWVMQDYLTPSSSLYSSYLGDISANGSATFLFDPNYRGYIQIVGLAPSIRVWSIIGIVCQGYNSYAKPIILAPGITVRTKGSDGSGNGIVTITNTGTYSAYVFHSGNNNATKNSSVIEVTTVPSITSANAWNYYGKILDGYNTPIVGYGNAFIRQELDGLYRVEYALKITTADTGSADYLTYGINADTISTAIGFEITPTTQIRGTWLAYNSNGVLRQDRVGYGASHSVSNPSDNKARWYFTRMYRTDGTGDVGNWPAKYWDVGDYITGTCYATRL